MSARSTKFKLLLALFAASTSAFAQSYDSIYEPLQRGDLTVWIVLPAPSQSRRTIADGKFHEQTSSDFGQVSSNAGQPSGSTGQTAGDFGQTSSTAGQTSSSVGQTAGSFGSDPTGLAQAAEAAHRIPPPASDVKHDGSWDKFEKEVRTAFPNLNVRFVDVSAVVQEFGRGLPPGPPDVILFDPRKIPKTPDFTRMWGRYAYPFYLQLSEAPWLPQREQDLTEPEPLLQALIPIEAHHRRAALAFEVWLGEGNDCNACRPMPPEAATPVEVATRVMHNYLLGGPVMADIDKESVLYRTPPVPTVKTHRTLISQPGEESAYRESQELILPPPQVEPPPPDGRKLRIDLIAASANQGFAVVSLRVIVEDRSAFAVRHPLIVLRTDETGRWHVLQISNDLPRDQQTVAWNILDRYSKQPALDKLPKPLGISQAAPVEGDLRGPMPYLWWDNKGGAVLQVVEWDSGDKATRMFFVPDANSLLRTQVTARFATQSRPYHWRVWSVGANGSTVLSPWHSFTINPR